MAVCGGVYAGCVYDFACVCVSTIDVDEGEGNVPLLRKVRHSFPDMPPTSNRTSVDAPRTTVPVVAAAVAVAADKHIC